MTPEAHRRCQEVFDQACERPAEDRVAFVSRELRDSPALLAHTLSLVANCSFSSEIQGKPGPGDAAPAFSSRVLGDFQLEGVLGEGGMGTVYRASQRSVGRAVALKVMKAGLAKPAQLRQFEDEIRSVGKLEHPGIARLYSADWFQSETGNVPYFAMELVEGVSLSVFAAARRLSTRSRLELVALVADAVEFANSQGVIHRDLKPANILVTAQGTPKVLDFGLARLIAPGDAVQTVLSQADQLLGTLAYMSPEQARDSRRADARSDVYSLGVILYELLADRLPYPVQGESVLTALRIIDEANLIPLRVRRPELSGDIDTIASKALSKDPAARYQSAGELAADIRRHLRDEPIIARPPGRLYLAGKFARRNKVAVLAGAGMFLALSVGLVISTAALSRSRASESSKEAALKQLREQEYDIYAAAAGTVKSIELSTLAEMVREDVTPEQFADFIDRAIVLPTLALARSLDSKISPKLRVGFLAGSADVYVRLERFADAEPLLIEVIGTLGSIDDSPTREYDIAVNKVNLAAVYRKTDRAALAEPLLTQALAPLRASSTPSDRQDFVKTLNTLAKTRLDLGQAAAGETVAREALAIQRELTGQVEEEGCGRLLCTIGDCVLAQGRVTEAAAEYEHALSIPTFAVPGPLTMTCVQPRLAEAYITMGRLEDARRVLVGTDVHLKDPASPRSFRVRVHETYVELFDALAAREPGAGHEQSASAWRQRLLLLRAAP